MSRGRKLLIAAVLALIVIGGLNSYRMWHHYKGSSDYALVARDEYDPRIVDPNTTFSIVVDDNKLVEGPSDIHVQKGKVVNVNISARGTEARLKLAGYDVISEASPGAPGGFKFIADKAGVFKFYVLPEHEADMLSIPTPIQLGTISVE